MTTNIQIVKQAQVEQTEVIGKARVALIEALHDLESIGGKDNYASSLRTIVAAFPHGIALSKVQAVLPDVKLLAAARVELKDEIAEVKIGQGVTFRMKTAAVSSGGVLVG